MEQIPSCLFCGRCLNVCPLFQLSLQEELSPRSKAFSLNLLLRGDDPITLEDISPLMGICLGCGRCYEECPQHIFVPDMVIRVKERCPSFKRWVFGRFISSMPWIFQGMGGIVRGIGAMLPVPLSVLLSYASEPPADAFELPDNPPSSPHSPALVFTGCGGAFLRPIWSERALFITSFFYEPISAPPFLCCGYPLLFAGLREKAKEYMLKNIEIWRDAGRPSIVVSCATCELALSREYPPVFEDEKERERWRESIVSLSSLVSKLNMRLIKGDLDFVFHRPCHLSLEYFEKLFHVMRGAGAKIVKEDNCCGFGGSMRLENPTLCDMLGRGMWERIGKENTVVSGCTGCIIQLKMMNPSGSVFHYLDLIKI